MNAAKLSPTAAQYLAQAKSASKLVVTYENGKSTHRQAVVDKLVALGLVKKIHTESSRVHLTRHRAGLSITSVFVAV